MDIMELFEEDPNEKHKFKDQLPKGPEKDSMIYDYFEQNSKKQQI